LVHALALGICGTDRDIVDGHYGWAPPGQTRLILGHESFGRVESAPSGCEVAPGDFVVGIVRRPDPVPCPACAAGEWDMCRNGRYTERGIKDRNGYGAEFFRLEPEFAVRVDPALGALGVLLEPASILAKAWDHVTRIGARTREWKPRTLLVTGAGPVGLLAALMGHQRDLELHVLDHNEGGLKGRLVHDLGGTYHTKIADIDGLDPDIIMECTGAPQLIQQLIGRTAPGGIMCLTGISNPGKALPLDLGNVNRTMVLGNEVLFGSVNANRKHYQAAADALAGADHGWLERMITRRVPLDHWTDALVPQQDDIKVVVDLS
jgi:glucose 1-dehydrogenase